MSKTTKIKNQHEKEALKALNKREDWHIDNYVTKIIILIYYMLILVCIWATQWSVENVR